MIEVIKLFKRIQETSSLNDKKAIIIANRDNELFKKCLRFLLDGNIITGLSAKKIVKKVPKSEYILPTFEDVMKYLKQNNTGTDYDISMIQAFLDTHKEDREFYKQMITKSFKLGADSKIINTCIPNLIPTWEVMLGTSIEHCKIPEGTWFSLSQKLNGNRCTYYNGEFYTRQNKRYIGLGHIKADIESIPNAKDYVFDGELIYKNKEGLSDSAAFQKGTGLANNKSENKEELKLIIFDVLPKEEFDNKISKDTYKTRKQHLLQLKQYETENIQIVRMFYEGTGRNKGKLGAFVVDYKGNHVKVGSGYNDEERLSFWNNREEYIGRTITVKYKEISRDKKTGLESLQFPVYCGLREPGKEPSYN